ncbi:hypothetical protein O181_114034 [Austropuccinia psidii MF-1]|uniref:Uncharacterized protein n=1 Tax=Austropuccinia psidii MF-1 TaxID=1389203 RepID=A0A9Q3K4M7_9BASI|nr:hypothetical protein [Austropuccinia psidii MF-1]
MFPETTLTLYSITERPKKMGQFPTALTPPFWLWHSASRVIDSKNSRFFALFKKLGIKAEELESLLAQAGCHAPPTLDQLITAAILSKGKEKPSLTLVGQVILNVSQTRPEVARLTSPFVYQMSNPPESASAYPWPNSPYHGRQVTSASDVRRPPDHLIERLSSACFHCGQAGHW